MATTLLNRSELLSSWLIKKWSNEYFFCFVLIKKLMTQFWKLRDTTAECAEWTFCHTGFGVRQAEGCSPPTVAKRRRGKWRASSTCSPPQPPDSHSYALGVLSLFSGFRYLHVNPLRSLLDFTPIFLRRCRCKKKIPKRRNWVFKIQVFFLVRFFKVINMMDRMYWMWRKSGWRHEIWSMARNAVTTLLS